MRILVTGGAGYVGSHVVRALLAAEHEVVVYDNLSTGHAAAVKEAELVVGDVKDRESLQRVLSGRRFDGAIHLAALSLVGVSVRDPAQYFNNNVVGGISLFDDLVKAEVPWVVFSSTAAVYGEPTVVPVPETHHTHPTSPYGESKLFLERALAWYERAYGLRSIALRYFNAAGADARGDIGEDHSPETHLIPIVLQVALGTRPHVEVLGTDYATPDGTAIRDYVHVSDLANAHVAAMNRLTQGASGSVCNLGSQRGNSVLEVLEAARRVTGRRIDVRAGMRRPGDPAVLVAEAERAQRELGWKPSYGLDDIVGSAWQWHAAHPKGYC